MPVLSSPAFVPPSPAAAPWLAKTVLWTSAAGVTLNLSSRDGGYACQLGRAGFGPVDAQLTTDTMWDGSTLVRSHRPQPRTLILPLLVEGSDAPGYLAALRALQASFRHPLNASSGLPTPGRITVQLQDGSSRSIAAFYAAGAAPSEDELDDVAWNRCMLPNLQFYAPVPTWEGVAVTQSWGLATAGAGVPPMPPVTLSSSHVLGATTITNPGDADAYPVWTITGPGTPTITNTDSGAAFNFTVSIAAGVTVTVDCRTPALSPATGLTATDNLGNDWWPNLASYPSFWPLPPGQTNISLTVAGATAATSVALTATARWLGGW